MTMPELRISPTHRLALHLWGAGTVLGSAAGIAQWILHIGGPARMLGNLAYILAFPVLVSRGIGMSLLPVRFGVPPEIVEITLTRA